ncbi:collagen-binding protein [Roseivirga thermotolerans]|uniref:Collagen-binding protein n=2 Tax=Roseivirga thermotolerans TaxID=1758176 RepID=A0ABQ3I894_9BACT|nr:collagen-binding protein [Roseivirga thermotolerans]
MLWVGLPLSAYQNKGNLSGYVTDAKTGESIPGATVQVLELQTGAITNAEGFYTLENLPTRTFTLQVSFVGYETQTKFNIVIRSGGNPDVNFELKETISELGQVVVMANPFQKIEETPLSIQKLSREEIATYPGGNNDIAKVVQSLPGVSGSVGGFRNDIIIRGGAPNENVYYLDGIEIPNINHFATQGSAGGPVGLLNVSFFEGVTLSTSAFAAQYDNALSGVLQFDQRNGNNREFRTNFRLSSSESALTFEGPLFKGENETSKTSFIASARRSYLQFLFQALDLPFLPDYWDYQYKLTHAVDEYNEIIITGVGSVDDFSINVPDEYDEEQQATLDQVPVIKQQTNTIGVSWKRRNKYGKGFSTFSLSNNRLNNDFRRFENNENQTGLYLQNLSTESETKFRYNSTRFKGNWTLVSSAGLQFVSYENNSLDLVNNNNFDNQISFTKYGVSFQASSISPDDRLKYSLGIRVDGNSFTESGNDFWQTLSPRASASYTFDALKKWSVNASLGRYYKIPPYTILGYSQAGSLVNKNTEYIRSDHAVLGLEYLLNPSSRFTLEGFYKKYDNYPVSLEQGVSLANLGGDFSVLGNENVNSTGEGRTYGMEFLYQKKFTNNYYAILAYTWYKSEFTGLDGVYRPSAWDSNHLLTFTGGYKFGNNWELSARMRYLGSTPYAPVDRNATLENYPAIIKDNDQLGSVRLNAFNQTDIRIDKKWNFSRWTFNVFLELQNAFGQDIPNEPEYGLNRDAQGNITTPRQLVLIEGIDNSSILPSLGIVIDF